MKKIGQFAAKILNQFLYLIQDIGGYKKWY